MRPGRTGRREARLNLTVFSSSTRDDESNSSAISARGNVFGNDMRSPVIHDAREKTRHDYLKSIRPGCVLASGTSGGEAGNSPQLSENHCRATHAGRRSGATYLL